MWFFSSCFKCFSAHSTSSDIDTKAFQSIAKPARASQNVLISAVCGKAKRVSSLPKDKNFGDDAWFMASASNVDVIGIADGVGSWHKRGIDVSKFSSRLMELCEFQVKTHQFNRKKPEALLYKSLELMNSEPIQSYGSSTVSLLMFNRCDGKLYSANVGDSGFIVIRDNQIIQKSNMQLHSFNMPYQVSILPQGYRRKHPLSPHAEIQRVCLVRGDLILLATDGVFDNLSLSEITTILSPASHATTRRDLHVVVESLINSAYRKSVQQVEATPFEIKARENNRAYRGGKPDDMTAILGKLVSEPIGRSSSNNKWSQPKLTIDFGWLLAYSIVFLLFSWILGNFSIF